MVLVVKVDLSNIVLYIVAGCVVVSMLYSPFFSNDVKASSYAGAVFKGSGCIMDRNSFAQFGSCDIPKHVAESITKVATKEHDADIMVKRGDVTVRVVTLTETIFIILSRLFGLAVFLFMICLMSVVWFWCHR
nr:P15 protein [Beet necrotic yellow vein virus]